MSIDRDVIIGFPLDLKQQNTDYDEIAKFLGEEWHKYLRKKLNLHKISKIPTIGMYQYSSLDENNNRKKHLIIAFSGSENESQEERSILSNFNATNTSSNISEFLKYLTEIKPNWWQSWEKTVGEIEIVTEVNISQEGMAHKYGYYKLRYALPNSIPLENTLPKYGDNNFRKGHFIVSKEKVYIAHFNEFVLLQPQPNQKVIANFCKENSIENRLALVEEVDRIVSNHNDEILGKYFPRLTYLHEEYVDLAQIINIRNWKKGETLQNGAVVITKNPKNIYIKKNGNFESLAIAFDKEELNQIGATQPANLRKIIDRNIISYNENLRSKRWLSSRYTSQYKCGDPKLAGEREKRMQSEREYIDEKVISVKAILKDSGKLIIKRIRCCEECQARANDFRMIPMTTVSLQDGKNQAIEVARPPSPVGTTKMSEKKHLPFQKSVDWFVAEANFQINRANNIKIAAEDKNDSFESLTKQRQKELCHENAIFYLNHAISTILEKKLLNPEDFFKLAQLYELRATQKKVLGFQEYKNDLIIAQQYYEKMIDHFTREGKSLTENIQKRPPGAQERAHYFMQRAEINSRLQQIYDRLKVINAKEKESYEQAAEKYKQWQRQDTLAYYANTIKALSLLTLSLSGNIQLAKTYQELGLYKRELNEPYGTEIKQAMIYYLYAANKLDASINFSTTIFITTTSAAYLQLSDLYGKLFDCAQDPHYFELAKIYAAIAGLLLKENQLSQQSHAILEGWKQEKTNNFQAFQKATQDLINLKNKLNIPVTTGDASLSTWASQALIFWTQPQNMKNNISLTQHVGRF